MLPAFVLSSMILGYFLQKIIRKEIKNKNIEILLKVGKIVLLIIIGIFFIVAFYFSNPIQIITEEGWNFKNPKILAERYPLNLEGLDENSILVTTIGVRAVEYGVISFNPKLTKEISSDSINLLENVIDKGHDVYTFKVPFTIHEKNMIVSLVNEYEFTLKEHSETFCRIEASSEKSTSDENCLNNEPIRMPQT